MADERHDRLPGSVSRETSWAIYEDALVAYDDENHPCHRFADLQTGMPPGWEWQLPIPFMGRRAGRGIVFLGINPSYGPGDDPRLGCGFETFDRYWREWFESHADGWPPLYRRYQEIGARAVEGFRLGEDALVLEVIRYRSATAKEGWTPKTFEHEGPMTLRVLGDVTPKVILTCGKDALQCLGVLLPDLQEQLPGDFSIKEVEGQIFAVESSWGGVAVIGARHITGSWMTRDDRLRLGDHVRMAVEGG